MIIVYNTGVRNRCFILIAFYQRELVKLDAINLSPILIFNFYGRLSFLATFSLLKGSRTLEGLKGKS